MSIDTGIPCGTRQVFVFPVWDVLVCPTVTKFLGQTKIDDVNEVSLFTQPHEEVVGFDIYSCNSSQTELQDAFISLTSMNEISCMNKFNTTDLSG